MFSMSNEEVLRIRSQQNNAPYITLLGNPRRHNTGARFLADRRMPTASSTHVEPEQHKATAKSPKR